MHAVNISRRDGTEVDGKNGLSVLAARRFKQSHLIYEGILADIQLLRQRHENATGVRGHFN